MQLFFITQSIHISIPNISFWGKKPAHFWVKWCIEWRIEGPLPIFNFIWGYLEDKTLLGLHSANILLHENTIITFAGLPYESLCIKQGQTVYMLQLLHIYKYIPWLQMRPPQLPRTGTPSRLTDPTPQTESCRAKARLDHGLRPHPGQKLDHSL